MSQLYQRLERCREIGGLTLADLALWLETPRETVKSWMIGRHYPTPALRTELFRKLDDLELAIAEANGPLVPSSIRRQTRPTYLRGLLDARQCKKIPVPDNT
jgi:hypothetical protein